mmetsp:Transcript_22241/g.66826  ORF Transcript_22241/g.66826 Transcript_22241/m.66826 type:complete len:212 (-) Transcript_22241:561-1196(-)
MIRKLFNVANDSATSRPKTQPAPRGLMPHLSAAGRGGGGFVSAMVPTRAPLLPSHYCQRLHPRAPAFAPSDVVGIGPQEIAHRARAGYLNLAVNESDLIERRNSWRQPAVDAENLVVHNGRQRKVIEDISAQLPNVCRAVLAETLFVKAVHLRDLPRLVVPPKDRHAISPPHLHCHHQRNTLHRVVPAVDIVAEEDVVCVGAPPRDAEELG